MREDGLIAESEKIPSGVVDTVELWQFSMCSSASHTNNNRGGSVRRRKDVSGATFDN